MFEFEQITEQNEFRKIIFLIELNKYNFLYKFAKHSLKCIENFV